MENKKHIKNKFDLGDIVVVRHDLPEERKKEILEDLNVTKKTMPGVFVVSATPGYLPYDLTIKKAMDDFEKEGRPSTEDERHRAEYHCMFVIHSKRAFIVDQDDFEELDPLEFLKKNSGRLEGAIIDLNTGKTDDAKDLLSKWKNFLNKSGDSPSPKKPIELKKLKPTVSFQDVEDSIRRSTSTPPKTDGPSKSDEKKSSEK